MNRVYYVAPIVGLVGGAILGCFFGWLIGWSLTIDSRRSSPSRVGDPHDGAAYLMLVLMVLGSCLGALIGLLMGVVLYLRVSRR